MVERNSVDKLFQEVRAELLRAGVSGAGGV